MELSEQDRADLLAVLKSDEYDESVGGPQGEQRTYSSEPMDGVFGTHRVVKRIHVHAYRHKQHADTVIQYPDPPNITIRTVA